MATTISNANLTVSVSASVTLGGRQYSIENITTIANINESNGRIVTALAASEQTIMAFGTAAAAGTYIAANVKCIIIVNKDDTNFVRIRVKKTGAETFDIKIPAGAAYIMWNTKESVSATAGAFSAFVDADSISAQADTANVDLEIFVASI